MNMTNIMAKYLSALVYFCISIQTFALQENKKVGFFTKDGIKIAANLSYINSNQKTPAIIFIHQGGSDKSEWVSSRLFEEVVKKGFVALAIDIRGHGDSGGKARYPEIFNDPDQAPYDVLGALSYLRTLNFVDTSRIAVVGSSIGSNLACVASGKSGYNIKTAVAISGKTEAVFNLAGGKTGLKFKSIYHISSRADGGGNRAKWATELYDLTNEPRKFEIIDGSAHGVEIFKNDTTLEHRIFEWLVDTL